MPKGLSYKNKFDLFLGDNCGACNGMKEKAEQFAFKHRMRYKVYHNSKEVPHIPCIRYNEFYIIGNKGFEKLLWAVKAKREGIL